MSNSLKHRLPWHAGPLAWGPAVIAGLGCALPLLLGLATAHSGFLWAAIGALQASQANPLNRIGMLRMLLLTGLGALSAALGLWAAYDPLLSAATFACAGLLVAWLHRFGSEASKLGIGLSISLCLGQGQFGIGNLHNPAAVAMLFALGGLWVMLLGFALRGLHGLRLWPYMPRLISLLKVLKRHAKRLPAQQWHLHAWACCLAYASAALIVNLANLSHGYWLTLAVMGTLQLGFQRNLSRALLISLATLGIACALIALGYRLQDPASMVAIALCVVILGRAMQASHYALYAAQTSLAFMLLAESISLDWHQPQMRLLNVLIGTILGLAVTWLLYSLEVRRRRAQRSAKRQSTQA